MRLADDLSLGGSSALSATAALRGFFTNFWKLSDTADAIGTDTLTNTNAVTFAAGKIGNGANYVAASSQVLQVTDAALSPFRQSRTFCVWFKPTATALASQHSFATVGDIALETQPLWILGVSNTANKLFLFHFGASGAYHNGSTTLVAGTWYCIMYVYDQATQVNTVYLNGNVEIQFTEQDASGAPVKQATLFLGSGYNAYWDGMLDVGGFAVNKVASAQQVSAYYNGGSGAEPPF